MDFRSNPIGSLSLAGGLLAFEGWGAGEADCGSCGAADGAVPVFVVGIGSGVLMTTGAITAAAGG